MKIDTLQVQFGREDCGNGEDIEGTASYAHDRLSVTFNVRCSPETVIEQIARSERAIVAVFSDAADSDDKTVEDPRVPTPQFLIEALDRVEKRVAAQESSASATAKLVVHLQERLEDEAKQQKELSARLAAFAGDCSRQIAEQGKRALDTAAQVASASARIETKLAEQEKARADEVAALKQELGVLNSTLSTLCDGMRSGNVLTTAIIDRVTRLEATATAAKPKEPQVELMNATSAPSPAADIRKINELRERSQAGFGDCKQALIAADGDVDEAAELIKKQGLATAQPNRAARAHDLGVRGLVEPPPARQSNGEIICVAITEGTERARESTKKDTSAAKLLERENARDAELPVVMSKAIARGIAKPATPEPEPENACIAQLPAAEQERLRSFVKDAVKAAEPIVCAAEIVETVMKEGAIAAAKLGARPDAPPPDLGKAFGIDVNAAPSFAADAPPDESEDELPGDEKQVSVAQLMHDAAAMQHCVETLKGFATEASSYYKELNNTSALPFSRLLFAIGKHNLTGATPLDRWVAARVAERAELRAYISAIINCLIEEGGDQYVRSNLKKLTANFIAPMLDVLLAPGSRKLPADQIESALATVRGSIKSLTAAQGSA